MSEHIIWRGAELLWSAFSVFCFVFLFFYLCLQNTRGDKTSPSSEFLATNKWNKPNRQISQQPFWLEKWGRHSRSEWSSSRLRSKTRCCSWGCRLTRKATLNGTKPYNDRQSLSIRPVSTSLSKINQKKNLAMISKSKIPQMSANSKQITVHSVCMQYLRRCAAPFTLINDTRGKSALLSNRSARSHPVFDDVVISPPSSPSPFTRRRYIFLVGVNSLNNTCLFVEIYHPISPHPAASVAHQGGSVFNRCGAKWVLEKAV